MRTYSKFILVYCLALTFSVAGCKHKEKVPEQAPAQGVVIDVSGTVVEVKEKNDPEGKEPVPAEALPTVPDGEASPKDPVGAPVNDGEEEEDGVACKAEANQIMPGSILVRPGGKFEVLGTDPEVPANWKGYTTYWTMIHGVKYRIIKEGVRKSTDPLPGAGGASPTPGPVVEGDWQKDPNTFATSKYPLGVDQIVKSGKLTAEQIESLRVENVDALFTYLNPDKLSPGYEKDLIYMLQRFIADGYLRGVNVIPIIKAQSHKLVIQVRKIKEYSNEPLGLAVGETVSLSTRFWTTAPFYSRLRTFYHELGHALFEREHMCGTTLMHAPFCNTARPYPRGTAYDPLMDEFFSFKSTWKTWKALEGGARKNCPLSGC